MMHSGSKNPLPHKRIRSRAQSTQLWTVLLATAVVSVVMWTWYMRQPTTSLSSVSIPKSTITDRLGGGETGWGELRFHYRGRSSREREPLICPTTLRVPPLFAPRQCRSFKGFSIVHRHAVCKQPFVLLKVEPPLQWSLYEASACPGLVPMGSTLSDGRSTNATAFDDCASACFAKRCCSGFSINNITRACWLFRCGWASVVDGQQQFLHHKQLQYEVAPLFLIASQRTSQIFGSTCSAVSASNVSTGTGRKVSSLEPIGPRFFLVVTGLPPDGVIRVSENEFEYAFPAAAEVTIRDCYSNVDTSGVWDEGSLQMKLMMVGGEETPASTSNSIAVVVQEAVLKIINGRASLAFSKIYNVVEFVGKSLVLEFSCLVQGGHAVHPQRPEPRRVSLLVHRRSNAFALIEQGGIVNALPAASCGAHLANNEEEFCVRGLAAVHRHTEYDGLDASSEEAVDQAWTAAIWIGSLDSTVTDDNGSVFEVIDGFYSKFSNVGVAQFPNLILRRRERLTTSTVVTLHLVVDGLVVANLSLPYSRFDLVTTAAVPHGTNNKDMDKTDDESTMKPILLSLTVHQCPSCLEELLSNIAWFVPSAVIVVHVSPSGTMTQSDVKRVAATFHRKRQQRLTEEGGVHAAAAKQEKNYVFINPHSTSMPNLYLHVAHALNVQFMLRSHPQIMWTHVVWVQSNERFVKHGLADYVQRYDASRPDTTSAAGITHHHMPRVQFLSPLDIVSRATFDSSLLMSILSDVNLQRLIATAGATSASHFVFPSTTVMSEGTFFHRGVAQYVTDIVLSSFDPLDTCQTSGIVHEYTTVTLLHLLCTGQAPRTSSNTTFNTNLRCGERVSMLARNRDDFRVTTSDILMSQCSPFEPPFAMKRFVVTAETINAQLSTEMEGRKITRRGNASTCRRARLHAILPAHSSLP